MQANGEEKQNDLRTQVQRILEVCNRGPYINLSYAILAISKNEPVSAILLTVLLGWTGLGALADGWIAKSIQELRTETGVNSASALLTAKKHLVQLGLVHTKTIRWNGSNTTTWQVNLAKVETGLEQVELHIAAELAAMIPVRSFVVPKAQVSYASQARQAPQGVEESLLSEADLTGRVTDEHSRGLIAAFFRHSGLPLTESALRQALEETAHWAENGGEDMIRRSIDILTAKQLKITRPASIHRTIAFEKENLEKAQRRVPAASRPVAVDLAQFDSPDKQAIARVLANAGILLQNPANINLILSGLLSAGIVPQDVLSAICFRRSNDYVLDIDGVCNSARIQKVYRQKVIPSKRGLFENDESGCEEHNPQPLQVGYYRKDSNEIVFIAQESGNDEIIRFASSRRRAATL